MAGPEIAKTLSESLGAHLNVPMPPPTAPYPGDMKLAQHAAAYRGPPAALKLLHEERENRQRATQLRVAQRVGGLDPDLASLRLPRATLSRMQLARDNETVSLWQSLMQKINEFKW